MSSQTHSSQSALSAKEKVYGIDELREMIIQHFIFDKDGQPSKRDICMARLVDKTWLVYTSKLLVELKGTVYKPPLLELQIDFDTTTQMLCQVYKTGTVSNTNMDSFISPNHLNISELPFSLKMTKDCFREQNYSFFYQFLRTWANSLRQLYIKFPNCGGTMTFTFPIITFPILDRVTIEWEKEKLSGVNQHVFGNNTNSLVWLQYFLNAAPILSHLELSVESASTAEVGNLPNGVEYLHLPPTITCLNLTCFLSGKQLQTLTRNPLPSLERLVMQSDDLFRENDLTSEVLGKFQSSLQYLEVFALCMGILTENSKIPIRLPVLPKLRTFLVNSNDLELEPGQMNLERSIPALSNIALLWQTQEMVLKWIGNSKFEAVSNLNISIVNLDDNIDDNEEFYFGVDKDELFIVDIDEVLMRRILVAFPNITVLKLHIPCNTNDGLHLVFREMTQLQEFVIYCPWSSRNKRADDWTSAFLGMPVELVYGLKAAPYSWRSLDLQALSLNGVNIANLQALKSLTLLSYSVNEEVNDADSWLSDLVFHLAFLKMANLTSLTLKGKFKPSCRQIGLWEATIPRKISYTMQSNNDE